MWSTCFWEFKSVKNIVLIWPEIQWVGFFKIYFDQGKPRAGNINDVNQDSENGFFAAE